MLQSMANIFIFPQFQFWIKPKQIKAKFFKRINGNKKRTFVMKYKGKKSRGYYKIRFFTVKKGKIVYGSYSKAVRVK